MSCKTIKMLIYCISVSAFCVEGKELQMKNDFGVLPDSVHKLSGFINIVDGDDLDIIFHTGVMPVYSYRYLPYIAITHTERDFFTVFSGAASNEKGVKSIIGELIPPIMSTDYTLYVIYANDTHIEDNDIFRNIAFGICLHEDKVDIVGSDRAKSILRGMLQTASTQGSLKIFM